LPSASRTRNASRASIPRTLPDGFELDDDRTRVDVDAVHAYLTDESYWARGRSHEAVQRTIEQAARVVGLYDAQGAQVGFARVVSDDVHIAYLADVYVLSEHRRRGLGVELVREALDNGPQHKLRWWLATEDAHDLYKRFGFEVPGPRYMTRPGRP
jgi:GNAT superfamily N-acetyltransferase